MSSTEKVILTEGSLEDIADAIREKNGTETEYKPREMAPAIRALNTDTEWGEIGGTLSDQTDLQNALDTLNADLANKQDASTAVRSVNGNTPTNGAVEVTAEDIEAEGIGDRDVSGNPIIVNDAMASVAKSLSVDLEPVQYLHGYDHPWVGGAGKNLLPVTAQTATQNGITCTINKDSAGNVVSVTMNGTATANTSFLIGSSTIPAGSYIASKGLNEARPTLNVYDVSASTNIVLVPQTEAPFTLSESKRLNYYIYCTSGDTYNNKILYPMIRLSTESSDYAPYSNICPIYPHTQAEVQRNSPNIWDEEWFLRTVSGVQLVASKNPIPVLPNTTYFIRTPVTASIDNVDENGTYISYIGGRRNTTFVTPANCNYIQITINGEYGTTYNHDISVNYPATFTDYEPYQSSSAVMPFGQDVYGCHADFSGKVRVTLANIASYNGETIGEPWWSSMDEYVSGATPTIGAQVVYTLATPIELTLTPAQLTLLQGTNILTADGTINLTYLGSMASNVQDEIDEFENGLNNVIGSIAFIENSTAKTSHAVGDYVILNGIFCKVISAISSGETLSFGTNIQATTIGAELRSIWAQISA